MYAILAVLGIFCFFAFLSWLKGKIRDRNREKKK